MSMPQELRVLRDRAVSAQAGIDALNDAAPGGSRSLVAQSITISSYPTSTTPFAQAYAMNPCDLDGNEQEGASASVAADTSRVFYAWNSGTGNPASGTNLIVHMVGGRWVFEA